MKPSSNGRIATCALGVSLSLLLAAVPLAAGQDDSLPEGPGKQIVQSVCTQCHEIEMVTTQNFSKDEWTEKVDLMVTRGAHLTPEQIPTVVAYLASKFGKPEAGESAPPSASTPDSTSAPSASTPTPPSSASTPTSQSGNQNTRCGAQPSSASAQPKKRKRFWGFLKKKQSSCTGKETATSDNRGPCGGDSHHE